MNAPSLEEIAELLLVRAREHGASAADVVLVEGDSLAVGVRLGEIEKVKRARAKHLGLRVFAGQRSAITSTADFSIGSLRALAEESVALARVTAPDPFSGLPSPDDLAPEVKDLELYDPAVEQVGAEQAIEWCKASEAVAREADARITNSDGAEFHASSNRVVYASSAGFRGGYRGSHCSLSVVPVATADGSMERDYWYSSARRLGELQPPEEIGRIAAARTVRRLGARKVHTCEVPVVFDPETASSLVSHLAGAVCGNALYKGMSFLIGKLGQTLAPSFVEVYDDATLPGRLGSRPFDGEGLGSRRTTVIEHGMLCHYLLDSYSARKLSARSTANAARSVADAPYVSPTNFYLGAGSESAQSILAGVKSGLYVTELMGFGVNSVTGDYSRGASGLWIENGELAYPVSEVTIAGNLLEMWRNIEALGSDLELRRAVSAPTLKIARLTVAGN